MKVYTLQIKISAIIEKTVAVDSLDEAVGHAKTLEWDDVLPGHTIIDGNFKTVGVFQNWDTDV